RGPAVGRAPRPAYPRRGVVRRRGSANDGRMTISVLPPTVQAPGFARTRVGSTVVTTVWDGALPILSSDMHGERPERLADLLADGFLPPEGDLLTAVNAFLFAA